MPRSVPLHGFGSYKSKILISGLSNVDALEIMTNIEESNVAIDSFKFSAGESTNIILTIKFNG